MPVDPSVQRKIDSMSTEAEKLRAQHQATQTAQSSKLKNDLEMLKNKKEQMLDADKKRKENLANQSEDVAFDATELVEAMLLGEKAATGGFDYEKQINDTLKSMGKADPDAGTAGSSADAPDAKFTHNGEEHNLEIKQNSKAMYGQIELKHDGKSWDISERSKKKYPETHKAIADSGFLKKINKQWDKPTGDYDEDLKMGNVYHDHPNADPIKAHYGKDRKTNYIQIGGGHGFYHTGNDAANLGSPELEGKTQFRARMKYRGTDKKTGKKKYGALIVMGLKDAEKSHHNLDNPTQKEWIEDIMNGHRLLESALNPKDPHGDYKAKKKALQDLSMNKDVDQKAVQQRTLDLDKEYSKYKTNESTLVESAFNDGFYAGETAAPLNVPFEKGTEEYNQYVDGYYRGNSSRLVRQVFEQAPVAPSIGVHRIAVTVSDPDHPMVTKRDETQQKFVRVTHHDAKAAIERAKKHFAKKGWKVHDAHYAGNVHESLQEAKIGDKVEIISGSAKGTRGTVGEIRHGLYKGAPKTYTVYHGEKDATQVKQHLVKRIKEDLDESHVEFRIDHRDKLTGDHKATFASHDAKVSDTTDKATYVKVPAHKADSFKAAMKGHGSKVELAESDASWEAAREKEKEKRLTPNDQDSLAKLRTLMAKEKKPMKESRNQADKYWDEAEEHKVEAKKHKVGTEAHHFHMSNHYDAMHRYHSDIGQHREADKAADKAEEHHEKSLQASKNGMAEEVAANNVGGGAIAGTQGDAGKKVVMTKEPLKRKPLAKFTKFVAQDHENA